MVQLPADLGRASNLLICKAAAPRQQGARAQPAVWLHGCARRCPGPRCQSHPRGELPGSRCCLASQKENRCVRSVENEVAARGYVNDRVTLALATCPWKRGGLRPARTREGLLLTHLRKRQVATPPPPQGHQVPRRLQQHAGSAGVSVPPNTGGFYRRLTFHLKFSYIYAFFYFLALKNESALACNLSFLNSVRS